MHNHNFQEREDKMNIKILRKEAKGQQYDSYSVQFENEDFAEKISSTSELESSSDLVADNEQMIET